LIGRIALGALLADDADDDGVGEPPLEPPPVQAVSVSAVTTATADNGRTSGDDTRALD
jgi:hypothetical protein